MGPLLCLIGLATAVAVVLVAYARYALVHSPGSLPFSTAMLWLHTWAYVPATGLGGMVLLLVFPEGRLLSPRWRPALWAAIAFIPLSVAGYAFVPQNLGAYSVTGRTRTPFVGFDALFEAIQVLALVCGLSLAWRRRRA